MTDQRVKDRLRETCVLFDGTESDLGSGFIVARGYAATANHVIPHHSIGDAINVQVGWGLGAREVTAVIYERDIVNDVALLRLQRCDDIEPLPVQPEVCGSPEWYGFGFPRAASLNGPATGVSLGGEVYDIGWSNRECVPQIILQCKQNQGGVSLKGVSGSAVVANGALIALIVEEFKDPDNLDRAVFGQLKALPIREVIKLLPSSVTPKQIDAERAGSPQAARWPSALDFTAYINERREHFSGRDWLFSKVSQWLAKPFPRTLLVSADYGFGKTAFVAQLLHRAKAGDDSLHVNIVGWHFCRHDLSDSLVPSAFVSSITAQLIDHLPAYRAAIEADPNLLEKLNKGREDPLGTFEALVLNPLARLPTSSQPALILIDAIDEALEYRSSTNIVTLLASRAHLFPSWLRVLVTSRKNPDVVVPLQAFGLEKINAEENDNLEDIYRYVVEHCGKEPLAEKLKLAGKNKEEIASTLRDHSGGKFLYVVRILDDVVNGHIELRDVQAIPQSMDNFYRNSFERRFSYANRDYEPTRQLLSMIAAAMEPLSVSLLAEILQNTEDAVDAWREPLADFIPLQLDCYSFDHFSVFEWLTRKDTERRFRAGRFAVKLKESRLVLTDWAWGEAQTNLQHTSSYVLRYLPAHLLELEDPARLYSLLCRFEWLQAKLQRLGIHAVLADFEQLPLPLRKDGSIELLMRTLGACAHILGRAPEQLATQLLGRLPDDFSPAIDIVRKTAWDWRGQTWMRPQWASMPPPSALMRLLKGHTDGVQSVAFSPDGSRIVSASANGIVRLWDSVTAQPLQPSFEGHTGTVSSVAFNPDGSCIVSAGHDGTVRLWDAGTGRPLRPPLEGHTDCVMSVAFSPDGSRIVSASSDGTVRLWDAGTGQLLRPPLEGHIDWVQCAVFTSDGSRIVSAGVDGTVRLWDAETGQSLWQHIEGNTYWVRSVAISPDDSRIVSASSDGTVRLWDAKTGRPLRPPLEGHTRSVMSVAFSPDGSRIVSAGKDGTVRLWDAKTGRPLRPPLEGHTNSVMSVAFSPDGSRIVSGGDDKTVRLWDAGASQLLGSPLEGSTGETKCVAFSPDGSRIVSGGVDKTVRLWNAETGQPLRPTLEGHTDWVMSVAFSPDGSRIVSAGADATVRIWDAETGKPLCRPLEGHTRLVTSVAFSPDGSRIVSAGIDGTVRLWDARTGQPLRSPLQGHTGGVRSVVFSRDGSRILSAGDDGTVRLWDTVTGKSQRLLIKRLGSGMKGAAFSSDGSRIVAVGCCGTVCLGDAVTRLRLRPPIEGRIYWPGGVAFSSDDCRIVLAGHDGIVSIWDTLSCETVAQADLENALYTLSICKALVATNGGMGGVQVFRIINPDTALDSYDIH